MKSDPAVAVACILLLALLALLALPAARAVARPARRRERDRFYTEHGQEEPTRSYVPYTGTLPFGDWEPGAARGPPAVGGHLPWAEAYPHAPHHLRSLWGPGATWR